MVKEEMKTLREELGKHIQVQSLTPFRMVLEP